MKNLLINFDKIGTGIFLLISVNFLFVFFEYGLFDYSKWKYVNFFILIPVFAGIVLVFKSTIGKIMSFLLGFSSIILFFLDANLQLENICWFVSMLPHFIANKTFYISELFYYIILPIIVVIYSLFIIVNNIKGKIKKIKLK